MKKIASFFMTILMAMTFVVMAAVPASAAEANGSITINSPAADQTYTIYKLLDLESYDSDANAYLYKVNTAWTSFFNSNDAKAYASVDSSGYVTWVENADAAAFAKLALAWAKEKSITAVDSQKSPKTVNNTSTVVFTNLELGYYLIDSAAGSLCGLTTTDPNAEVTEKNGVPTIDKQVQEDSTLNWGDENTADIGQTVNFRVTINVQSGAENYVLHDKMSRGLTFDKVSKVELVVPVSDSDTEITTALTPDTDYTVVSSGLNDRCTFEVKFTPSICDKLNANDKLIVYYEAVLNEKAVIANGGNPNDSYLEYGDNNKTTIDQTITKTFEFDLIKTNSSNELIDGAKFRLYDQASGGNEIAVVKEADGTYRRAMEGENGEEIYVKNGKAKISGLDNGVYYLEETEAPDGYNKLSSRKEFTISDNNLNAEFTCGGKYSAGSGVQVENKAGAELPSTGGMGTALFIGGGAVLMLGTGVVLVSRKRMSKRSA